MIDTSQSTFHGFITGTEVRVTLSKSNHIFSLLKTLIIVFHFNCFFMIISTAYYYLRVPIAYIYI